MSSSSLRRRRARAARLVTTALAVVTSVALSAGAQQPPAKPDPASPPAVVMGRIVGPDKQPLEKVEVLLDDTVNTFTDRKGHFSFDSMPPGTLGVLVRKIGYRPVRFRLEVTAGDVWDGTLALERAAQALPEVVVLDSGVALQNYRPPWIDGFIARRRLGMGTFIDRTQIERTTATTTAQLLMRVPGITTSSLRGFDEVRVSRCDGGIGTNNKAVVYVDGQRVESSVNGQFMTFSNYPPELLAAIEVYRGRSAMPSQYYENSVCLVVLLWTTTTRRR